jgi:hypothetical protein
MTIDIAELAQTLAECFEILTARSRRRSGYKPDPREFSRLLCVNERGKR